MLLPQSLVILALLASASAGATHRAPRNRRSTHRRLSVRAVSAGQVCRTRKDDQGKHAFQKLTGEGSYAECSADEALAYVRSHKNQTVITPSSAIQSSTEVASSTVESSSAESTSTEPSPTAEPSSSEAAPTPAPAPPPSSPPISSPPSSFTPNGIKAGISAGDAYDVMKDHIGWWYDWTPNPFKGFGNPIAVPMLWGAGTADHTDSERLEAFRQLSGSHPYIIGFEEPDCTAGGGSAEIDVDTAARLWNELMAPWADRGAALVSPSMCKQYAETYLSEFMGKIDASKVAIVNVHINKKSGDEVRYYHNKYGKPLWVTEFACVDDVHGFTPCTDQAEIDSFIYEAVKIFEEDWRVAAYAYSNGYGLGNVWPMWQHGGLSASGQTYLNAISRYH